ncbi:hypothetical protein O9929_04940 [Vibrio lentus]|nr:hypothetical protein [Vibrio lentus]
MQQQASQQVLPLKWFDAAMKVSTSLAKPLLLEEQQVYGRMNARLAAI